MSDGCNGSEYSFSIVLIWDFSFALNATKTTTILREKFQLNQTKTVEQKTVSSGEIVTVDIEKNNN